MNKKSSHIGTIILLGAILAAIAVGVMILGARFGLWLPEIGFRLSRTYMSPIGFGVVGLSALVFLSQLVMRNGKGVLKSLVAIIIGVALLAPLIHAKLNPTKRQPPIHDITTNMTSPPLFLVLDETRQGAKNSLIYGGADVADIQKKLYPDIAPIQSTQSAQDAFSHALNIAKKTGWEIVSEDVNNLRFEATARTSVYRFMDDVVVVVTAADSGSRVDIRSVSRIGRGDRGMNAARVRAFITAFGQ